MGVVPRTAPAYHSPTYQVALAALEAGMNVLPIRPDGTKQPALSGWKRYQQEMPPRISGGKVVPQPTAWPGARHRIHQRRTHRVRFR